MSPVFIKNKLGKRLVGAWFVAVISTGMLCGLGLAFLLSMDLFHQNSWLVLGVSLVIITLLGRMRFLLPIALIAGLLLGLWRGSLEKIQLAPYSSYVGKAVYLEGVITQDPVKAAGKWQLEVGKVVINGQRLPGQIWASAISPLGLKRSDVITLEGKLKPGFGSFPASMSFAKVASAKRPQPGDVALKARDVFADGVRKSIPDPEASLGLGYLVGQKRALPEELTDNLQIVGLTHVVVASGYNLTILVRLTRRFFVKISKYLAALSAGAMIITFIFITGFSPSMARAGLVAGLSLAAWYYGRRIHPMVLLPFTAAITAMVNPLYVWGDIGWYLSFAAFAGVVVLAPLVNHLFYRKQESPGVLKQIFTETITAQLATLPLIAFVFGHYSLFALPANLLVLPLVPLAMALTFIAGLAGMVTPSLAVLFGAPASALLGYMAEVVNTFAGLPFAQGDFNFGIAALIASYLAITLFAVLLWHKTRHDFYKDNIIE